MKDNIVMPKKSMLWMSGAIAVIAILLARDKAPEVLLFLIGIFVGIFIAKGYWKK